MQASGHGVAVEGDVEGSALLGETLVAEVKPELVGLHSLL